VDKQRTLASPATLTGSALHTGENVTLTILPAPAGHGFKFQRVDLPDEPVVDALAAYVKTVTRATTLVQGMVKIHTVEHVLSALSGLGVDNALIQMNANEPPIGDGSASAYVAAILKAGLVTQDAQRRYLEVTEPLTIEVGESILIILPDKKFRISCTQVGPEGRFTQFLSAEITPEFYEKELAPARTFVFYEEVKALMDKGLIKGGSLENAIVARGDSVLSKEPLRFPDEFVRHKMLDIVGDLVLCGRRLRAHVIAVKPSHGINTEAAKRLAVRYAQIAAVAARPVAAQLGAMDVNEIMRVLPHRFPFLMVDRVIEFIGDSKVVGVKAVSVNEPYFQGHFPNHPVMPGVLQLEAMAQVASIVMMLKTENAGKIGYFMSADDVKFRKPVFPGDTLFIECELTSMKKRIGKASCRCLVNGEVVSEGELLFGLVDK
jgi:UDP-3-O-[3-hydroxymyristoyl] N-acetylglucosamine deacetylase/3-hydroxyacyl-[acyl-carrier-protein] dehydratase